MAGKKSKPRGRPPLPPAEKRAKNFTFRSRGDMHDKLSEAASLNERSISEEIERRLERSFDHQDLLTEVVTLAYGEQMAGLLREMAPSIRALANLGPNRTLTFSSDAKGKLRAHFNVSADGDVEPPTDEEFDEMLRRHAVSKPEGQKK